MGADWNTPEGERQRKGTGPVLFQPFPPLDDRLTGSYMCAMNLVAPEVVEVGPDRLETLGPRDLSDPLERGGLVFFPKAPLELPSEDDIRYLRDETPKYHTTKNISYYPDAGRVNGMRAPRAVRDRVGRILREHHERVEAFLSRVLPTFRPGWTTSTSSLRAFQENGRALPVRKRSDLIHLDAGTYGATRGDLLLRFLTNLDDQDRVWRVKGTVSGLVEKYGREAGLGRPDLLKDGLADRAFSGLVRGLSAVFPMARSLDRSSYDRAMRRMHNFMKENEAFQKDAEGASDLRFPPRSCWTTFADMVGHSCTWGRFALIDTFIVPRANFRHPENAPYEVLRRYSSAVSGS